MNELQNHSETIPFWGKIPRNSSDLGTIKECRTFLTLIFTIKIIKSLVKEKKKKARKEII